LLLPLGKPCGDGARCRPKPVTMTIARCGWRHRVERYRNTSPAMHDRSRGNRRRQRAGRNHHHADPGKPVSTSSGAAEAAHEASAHRVRFRVPDKSGRVHAARRGSWIRADRGRPYRCPDPKAQTRPDTVSVSLSQPKSGRRTGHSRLQGVYPPMRPSYVARRCQQTSQDYPSMGLFPVRRRDHHPPGDIENRSSRRTPTRPDGADYSVQSGHGNPTRQCDSHSKLRIPHVEASRPLCKCRIAAVAGPKARRCNYRHSRDFQE
jgi:hypothetical protein